MLCQLKKTDQGLVIKHLKLLTEKINFYFFKRANLSATFTLGANHQILLDAYLEKLKKFSVFFRCTLYKKYLPKIGIDR